MNMKTGQVAGSAPAGSKSAEDIESEVVDSFRAMITMLAEDARHGRVKVTEGRDPKKRDWVNAKNAGKREDQTMDSQLNRSRGNEERKAEPDGAHAGQAIQTAAQDLNRLGQLGGGDPLQKTEQELAKMV